MKTILFLILLSVNLKAQASNPQCFDKKEKVLVDNHQALNLREFRESGFKTRALVFGTLVVMMEHRNRHTHLEIDLDLDHTSTDDRLEVIYNDKFGELPKLMAGDLIVACGDFIVDPNSPHKAIIHWLHASPSIKKHDHGYLMINNSVFGQ
jgi:hypothetical protein